MSVPIIQTSLIAGEVAPALFGHVDLARMHAAASTERNMFVGYRGGAYSRAGTKFVGFSKQTGRAFPPRMVPFQFNINQGLALEFGNFYMRVVVDGGFATEVPILVTGISNANPAVVQAVNTYANGDWVFISGVGGMSQVNGQTYVIASRTPGSFSLKDVYGNAINSTAFGAFTSNGTAARIYTLATIYSEVDLKYLKFTQSADVMSICCLNQITGTEYPPQDLSRISDIDWVFTPAVPGPSIAPPAVVTVTASSSGTSSYSYLVTAVSNADGTESIGFGNGVDAAVDIAATAGTITVTWTGVAAASGYNVYKATPGYGGVIVPNGAQYGFAGLARGGSFLDSNIIPDFSQVPPTHQNPFARGQIIEADVTAEGSGGSFVITINTATGSGAVLIPILDAAFDKLIAIEVQQAGENYLPTDTLSITGGATATLVVGPETGTYPSVPAYFQERRAYANTLNNPDTYFMSQPGAFVNFDVRDPTIASDAIIGSPWAQQVNGIQFMVPTSGGLLVFTGLSTWLLVGAGSFATNVQPISPATQLANPQPAIGCSATLQPIKVNYDVLFVGSKNSFYYDLPYQLYALSEPIDLSQNSTHLFVGHTFKEHAWCEQPNRILWTVRDDGIMLSLTYLKAEQVSGWARHDTFGTFQSVCSIIERPLAALYLVDALYLATQRTIGTASSAYFIERMDDRIWADVEGVWAVDCGLTLPQPTPFATLTASSATGLGACSGVTGLVGGTGYSAGTFAVVTDLNDTGKGLGPGAGAQAQVTVVAGQITAVIFPGGQRGVNYRHPQIQFSDPANTGYGASATIVLDNSATFTTDAPVFSLNSVGSVIRIGGGIAVITAYTSGQAVTANILSPITDIVSNSGGVPRQQGENEWTLTAPVTIVSGLNHLIGATVTGLADGNVIPPTVVSVQGTITLAKPATAITIGLGFQAQLQSTYLDAGSPTVQGQRKKIGAVTARIEASRGIKVGTNQPDGSTQSPIQVAPLWSDLADLPDDGPNFPLAPYNALATPLRTGDIRDIVQGGFQTPGQICFQQDNPLPMQVLAIIADVLPGDEAQTQVPKRQERGRQ